MLQHTWEVRVVRRPERCNFSGHVNYNLSLLYAGTLLMILNLLHLWWGVFALYFLSLKCAFYHTSDASYLCFSLQRKEKKNEMSKLWWLMMMNIKIHTIEMQLRFNKPACGHQSWFVYFLSHISSWMLYFTNHLKSSDHRTSWPFNKGWCNWIIFTAMT